MAEQIFTIPLANVPQRFAIDLSGKSYIMESVWNTINSAWEISLFDGDTEEPIFESLPLVTGVDLLAQYGYLQIGGSLVCYTDGDEFAPPTLENIGQEANLYYVTTT